MRILLVEDDHLLAKDLMNQLKEVGYADVHWAKNANEARNLYLDNPPLVALVDIKLGSGSVDGITLSSDLDQLGPHALIFLTGYGEEAQSARAQSLKPTSTLIKPVHVKQLKAALDIAIRSVEQEHKSNFTDFSFIKVNGKYKRIDWSEVLWVEAARSSVIIVTENHRICYSKSLKFVSSQIGFEYMQRVHRSYLVNLNRVYAFDESYLYLKNVEEDIAIPYTSTYRNIIYRRLQRFLTK